MSDNKKLFDRAARQALADVQAGRVELAARARLLRATNARPAAFIDQFMELYGYTLQLGRVLDTLTAHGLKVEIKDREISATFPPPH